MKKKKIELGEVIESAIAEFAKKHDLKNAEVIQGPDPGIVACPDCGSQMRELDVESEEGSPVHVSVVCCFKCKSVNGIRLKDGAEARGVSKRKMLGGLIERAMATFKNAVSKKKQQ